MCHLTKPDPKLVPGGTCGVVSSDRARPPPEVPPVPLKPHIPSSHRRFLDTNVHAPGGLERRPRGDAHARPCLLARTCRARWAFACVWQLHVASHVCVADAGPQAWCSGRRAGPQLLTYFSN